MSKEILEPPDTTSSPQEPFPQTKLQQTKKGLKLSKKPNENGIPSKRRKIKDRVKKNSKESDAIKSGTETGNGSGSGSASASRKKGEDNESGIKRKTASDTSPSYADADTGSADSETSSQFYLRESQTDVLEGTIIVTESGSVVNLKDDGNPESQPSPTVFNPCCCRRKSTRFLRDSCYVMGAVESSVAISLICIFSVFTMTGHQGKIIKFQDLDQDFADALTFLIWLATALTGIFQVSAASCKLMYMCTLNLVVNGIIILLVLGFIVILALYAIRPAIPLSLYAVFFILKIYMSLCTFGLLEQYRGKAESLAKGSKVNGNLNDANDKESRIFTYENEQNNSASKKVLLWNDKR